jgi:hypothetical protein
MPVMPGVRCGGVRPAADRRLPGFGRCRSGALKEAGWAPTRRSAPYPNPYPNQTGDTRIFAIVRQRACVSKQIASQRYSVHQQTSANVLAMTGGQVVAGSNPVSPTQVCAGQGWFSGFGHRVRSLRGPYGLPLAAPGSCAGIL